MAAINSINHGKTLAQSSLATRSNFASREPGVILVFCIVGVVGIGLVVLFSYRYLLKRKAMKERTEMLDSSA